MEQITLISIRSSLYDSLVINFPQFKEKRMVNRRVKDSPLSQETNGEEITEAKCTADLNQVIVNLTEQIKLLNEKIDRLERSKETATCCNHCSLQTLQIPPTNNPLTGNGTKPHESASISAPAIQLYNSFQGLHDECAEDDSPATEEEQCQNILKDQTDAPLPNECLLCRQANIEKSPACKQNEKSMEATYQVYVGGTILTAGQEDVKMELVGHGIPYNKIQVKDLGKKKRGKSFVATVPEKYKNMIFNEQPWLVGIIVWPFLTNRRPGCMPPLTSPAPTIIIEYRTTGEGGQQTSTIPRSLTPGPKNPKDTLSPLTVTVQGDDRSGSISPTLLPGRQRDHLPHPISPNEREIYRGYQGERDYRKWGLENTSSPYLPQDVYGLLWCGNDFPPLPSRSEQIGYW
ncbi:hypothetical protein SK128_014650 [Halocaridina rubra]|uniref:Uncharacterized protein n=1 Tax=Halocaridina rubra TaxID=373956 RepID=A0AAN8ZSZ3_HALRR